MQPLNKYLLTNQPMRTSKRRSIEPTRWWPKQGIASGICGPARYQWGDGRRHFRKLWKRLQRVETQRSKRSLRATCGNCTQWYEKKRTASAARRSSMRSHTLKAIMLKSRLHTILDSSAYESAMMGVGSILEFSRKAGDLITGACRECVSVLNGLARN